jgi:tetratricopeptide (TPR) repeat protein
MTKFGRYMALLVLLTIQVVVGGDLPAYVPFERDTVFLESVKKLNAAIGADGNNAESISAVLETLNSLKAEGYQANNPLLLYSIGRAYRALGKIDEDTQQFQKALDSFKSYRDTLKADKANETKTAYISIAYTNLDLGNVDEAAKEIETYLNMQGNEGDIDAKVCQAYVKNAKGYEEFKVKHYPQAVENFRAAYAVKKWPLFGHNLMKGLFNLIDKTDGETRLGLVIELGGIRAFFKGRPSWENDPKFKVTGGEADVYLRKYSPKKSVPKPKVTP